MPGQSIPDRAFGSVRHIPVLAPLDTFSKHVLEARARNDKVRNQRMDFAISGVVQNDAVFGVEQAKAVRIAFDRIDELRLRARGLDLTFAQCRFGLLLIRDVENDAAIGDRDALVVEHGLAGYAHPALPTRRALDFVPLHLDVAKGLAVGHVGGKDLGDHRNGIQTLKQLAQGPPFVAADFERYRLRRSRAKEREPLIEVGFPPPVGADFHEITEPSLVEPERLLADMKLGDVGEHHEESAGLCWRAADREVPAATQQLPLEFQPLAASRHLLQDPVVRRGCRRAEQTVVAGAAEDGAK